VRGAENRFGARRRAAVVIARLKGDEQSVKVFESTSLRELGQDASFGVAGTGALMGSNEQQLASGVESRGSDRRIRCGRANELTRFANGFEHSVHVFLRITWNLRYNRYVGPQYISLSLGDILVGEPLPVNLYIYLDFRFITFRAEGDALDRDTYDRLELKKVRFLFILDSDREVFDAWAQARFEEENPPTADGGRDFAELKAAREDLHRTTMDIFQSEHPDRAVAETIVASKRLVDQVMKVPFAVSTLAQLQSYSRGTVDHSVNVSVLSTYLAMQMGYSHTLILQHVGLGGLLHDIGKTQIEFDDADDQAAIDDKLREHPALGMKAITALESALKQSKQKIPNEVQMIIAQHHEAHDGTGYPKKLRGAQIYDLARIVAIANRFDELVGDGQGKLVERQRAAILALDQTYFKEFDPQKLEKALKILKLGV
jgi:putative nucleotidyltransferase with HDIG domain